MKAYILTTAAILAATPALAQQAQSPACPDFSRQLAMGIQAVYDRDAYAGKLSQLDAMVTDLKKQLADAQDKVKADDELIKSLRAMPPKKEEPPKP